MDVRGSVLGTSANEEGKSAVSRGTVALLLAAAGMWACEGNLGNDGGAGDGTDASGTGNSSSAGDFVASESVGRRLSRAELDNTLRDVFGDDSGSASTRLGEDPYDPFDNNYELQQASSALIDSLEALADDVAANLMADQGARDALVPCTPASAGDEDCFRQVIEVIGKRAFRRPLAEDEVSAYMTLLDFATEDNPYVDNDFYTAVELFIRSLVQDPEFLYRIEVGTPTEDEGISALDSYEIATRMAYLLWGSAPDDPLLSQADSDGLTDAAVRRTTAETMLSDERAREQIHRFHAMWLGYRAIPHPSDLVAEFNQETTALIDRVVFEDERSYLDLFTFDSTYVTDFLANHYGLSAPDGGQGWVAYDEPGRAGILSHGSVLAGFSKFSDTSPTQRGIFVQTRLMCNVIESPPANVDVDQPPGDQDAECKEARYAEHREVPSCANCHDQIDPVGLGLENYDIAGVWRDHDEGNPDCIISGEGELPGAGPFSGPKELGQMLVDEGYIGPCSVEHFLRFALGREIQPSESGLVDSVITGFSEGDHRLRQLIVDYIASDAFGLRKEPE